jgi:threonine/homoserine/homoserine lactone efflux protein
MNPSRFAEFVVVDLMLVMTPGADWAYAITAGVRGGRVLPAIAGLAGGYAVQAGLVVAGVGAVLAQSPSALQVLTYLGASYLLWLGIRVARDPAPLAAENLRAVSAVRGVATSGLNPKGLLLFFAVLPQFVARTAPWPVTVQLAVLGAIHIVACGLVYFCVAVGAGRLLRSRPRAACIIGRGSGIAMIVIAVALVIERVVAA